MLLKKYTVVVIGIIICLVNGHKEKSSLTFVIDITKSMGKEIEQVKNTTDMIFDKIFNSRTNNIDNFVLVTFGDPYVNVAVKTRDRNEFKQALQNIELQSGGYCPEASMAGIILALRNSHRNSFLYVFTDAAAADYKNATIVKSLSQKLSTQVNFLLTGKCKFATNKQNLVYDEIAETTSGHVFNIQKDEVSEIINFVVENLKSKTTVLKRKLVEDNFNKMIEFTIDSKISNVFICVSSSQPRFIVYNSKGTAIKVLNVMKSQKNSIVKLEKELNEQYFIKLDQNTRTLVTVTASTSICFQHGFSTSEPMSLDETSIKPSGRSKESYFLSIQLENDARDIMLEKAELVDVNDNIIFNTLPLTLIYDEEQFYSTENAYEVPYEMFRIAIIGQSYSGEIFRRVSITTIQRPDPKIEIKEEPSKIIPEVIILAKPNIHIELKKSISVTCKVRAVPEPNITWVDTYGQNVHPKIVNYDYPYYGSVLNIEKVDNEGSLTCIATNAVGTNKTSVNIRIIENMSTAPVVYEAIIGDLVLQIPCNAISEGSSVANVKWEYKLGEKTTLLSKKESGEYIIDNNASLILKNIKKNYEGFYKCSVESLYGNRWTESEVLVKEHIIPLASHLKTKTALLLGTSLSLPCDNWQVKPYHKGYARWYKDGYFIKNCSSEELCSFDLVNAGLIDTGIYTCRISTKERSISVHKQIIVYTNLNFINEVETTIAFKENELAFFDCNSYGVPTPEVTWSRGSRIISKNFTISFIMKIENIGQYECKVSNEMGGLIHRTFEITSDKECQLNMTFHRNMPLFLNYSAWIIGPVKINTKIKIMCIDSVISDNKRRYSSILVATCLEKTSFKTKEYGIIDISELKCEKEVNLIELKGNEKYCVKEPSTLISIMLPKEGGLIGIFDVCVDKYKNVTYFIQYKMSNGISNYAETKHMSFKSEDDLGCRITADKKCCFVKKHLISVEDMLPGLQQIAVHHYSNLVPQWSSCGTENWDEVGRRVRSLCTSLGTSTYLEVWIGISQLTLINDKYDEIHHVPRYIWKVIFNKNTLEGLAIIVENFPHASDHSCKSPCNFFCNEISWMKGAQWQNPSKGCVFCCSLGEFMNIFHYENIFPNTTKLLI